MSRWTNITTEIDGVQRAARNLDGDATQLARYVVDRACAYMGADHEGVVAALVEAALRAYGDRAAQGGTDRGK